MTEIDIVLEKIETKMDWLQVFAIVGSVIGACYYMHRENRNEIRSISDRTNSEMKDFHGRLCTLEERYLQMIQKILENKHR